MPSIIAAVMWGAPRPDLLAPLSDVVGRHPAEIETAWGNGLPIFSLDLTTLSSGEDVEIKKLYALFDWAWKHRVHVNMYVCESLPTEGPMPHAHRSTLDYVLGRIDARLDELSRMRASLGYELWEQMAARRTDTPDILLDMVRDFSGRIQNGRTLTDILNHMDGDEGEMKELRREVEIKEGLAAGAPGKDGVMGEAIDLLLCGIDLIFKDNPRITNSEILEYALLKCVKWQRDYSDRILKGEPAHKSDHPQ